MRKPKVILKLKKNEDKDMIYISKCTGDNGVCFTMAMGFAISLAKNSGISLSKVKELVSDIYKETEDDDNGED